MTFTYVTRGHNFIREDEFHEMLIKKSMYTGVITGNWKEVIRIFSLYLEVQDAKITESGETAIHMAVSEGNVDVVQQLVERIPPSNMERVLGAKNERGNTPLHLAAALGTVAICKCIAERDPRYLIGIRNHDGETPLFLAVLNGKTKAFLFLHQQSPKDAIAGCSYCRRTSDGDTILHCAIFGEYFGLADQIIDKYKDLVHWRNEKGEIPFHVLATKPSAFKSGSRLGIHDQIIYRSVFVDPLAVETLRKEDYEYDSEVKHSSKHPDNCRICVTFFGWLVIIIKVIGTRFRLLMITIKELVPSGKNNSNRPDIENPNKVSCGGSPGGPASISTSHEGESSNATQITSSEREPAKDPNPKPQRSRLVLPNYKTLLSFFKSVIFGLLVLRFGLTRTQKIKDKKQKHTSAIHIMDELVEHTSVWDFDAGCTLEQLPLYKTMDYEDASSTNPKGSDTTTKNNNQATNQEGEKKAKNKLKGKRETPILLAAKYGVAEIVDKILKKFPSASRDSDSDKKNVVLLAVENRQSHIYNLLLKGNFPKESVFRKFDNQGNSALHLAATLGKHKPWRTPGAALQMQWELKWYKFVKYSMPRHYFVRYNSNGQTPKEVFNETHKDLVKEGVQWINTTSQSCSLMAALIATVAFTSSSSVPGGVKQEYGTPTLEGQPVFNLFAITSLLALCFSVTSLIMFLALLTSLYQEKDFANNLPKRLIIGLGSLSISIVAMMISFCSGHFFVVKDSLKYAAYPLYAVACLPVLNFSRFPFYFDLIICTFHTVPQRSSK